MTEESPSPTLPSTPAAKLPLGVRKTLAEIETAVVDDVPSPRDLARFARRLAHDVAGYFDDLPMHLFGGNVRRSDGLSGYLLPTRRVAHRALFGRYKSLSPFTTPKTDLGTGRPTGKSSFLPQIDILALGVDGQLRVGSWYGYVVLATDSSPKSGLFEWSHGQMHDVPSRPLLMQPWEHTSNRFVAEPAEVIAALRRVAVYLGTSSLHSAAIIRGDR